MMPERIAVELMKRSHEELTKEQREVIATNGGRYSKCGCTLHLYPEGHDSVYGNGDFNYVVINQHEDNTVVFQLEDQEDAEDLLDILLNCSMISIDSRCVLEQKDKE